MYQDRYLTCRDCGEEFLFSASEQNQNRSRDGYTRQNHQMYPAVCAACGKGTEVPFQPREDRPVYCRDCYRPAMSY